MKQHIGISIAVQTPPPFLVVLCRFPSFLNPNINTILILLMLDIGFILPIKAKQSKAKKAFYLFSLILDLELDKNNPQFKERFLRYYICCVHSGGILCCFANYSFYFYLVIININK